MAVHALFPGTFDPPTLGHLDLLERGARLFERVTIGIAENASKQAVFALEERLALLRACAAGIERVEVVPIGGLVVEACRVLGADTILRGLRNGTDFDFEAQMAHTNRVLAPDLDTVFLPSSTAVAHISSTLVRQIASLGGDCAALVPAPVAAALARRYRPSPS